MMPPPRRLDIEGHEARADWLHELAVFVDGEPQSRVLEYDVDRGYVRRFQTRDGCIVVDGPDVLTEIVRGRVQVGWRNRQHA